MVILLTGKDGQVGKELQRSLSTIGDIIAVNRQQMDLADPDLIRTVIQEVKPNLIVNAAAYTAVDKAESEPDLAMAINGTAPGIMAEEAKLLGAAMVHYSTDYVFDGAKNAPYTEEDQPNPINIYGKTKLAGERVIQETGLPHIILRTSWVYAPYGRNFLSTMLRVMREKKELKIVDDQIGAPTWSQDIARCTERILALRKSWLASPDNGSHDNEVMHLTAGGRTSWYGFAKKILQHVNNKTLSVSPKIIPISSDEYITAARRPMNSILSNALLKNRYGIEIPPWEHGLEKCMKEIPL